jgi:hypothetical protein
LYDVHGSSSKKEIIFNFSVATTYSFVSGELVVADVSELYINGIIGEFYRLIYTGRIKDTFCPTTSSSRHSDR